MKDSGVGGFEFLIKLSCWNYIILIVEITIELSTKNVTITFLDYPFLNGVSKLEILHS